MLHSFNIKWHKHIKIYLRKKEWEYNKESADHSNDQSQQGKR